MATNEFEKVSAVQPDALTFELSLVEGVQMGAIYCPSTATHGRLPKDYASGPMPAKEAFRAAVQLANEMKVPIVVLDPLETWPHDWGVLFVTED